jgi:hypothetical protein
LKGRDGVEQMGNLFQLTIPSTTYQWIRNLKKRIKFGLQLIIIQQRLRQLNARNRIASHRIPFSFSFYRLKTNLHSSTHSARPHLIVRRISRINLLLVPIEDLLSVQLLRRSSVALITCQLKRTRGVKDRALTFCGVHSSSATTAPSIISIPDKPPCLPACCNSFKTAS